MTDAYLTIHRGTHQIGGICTEVSCGGERVLIDLGANLEGYKSDMSDGELLSKVFDGRKTNGLLITHPHGDHYGLYKQVPEDVPIYIGSLAKQILEILTSRLDYIADEKGLPVIERMRTFSPAKAIPDFKQIKITPFCVDHSAPGAFMFFIEGAGRKILYTGDFRTHGIIGRNDSLLRTVQKYKIKNIDVLITEGTTLSRQNAGKPLTEWQLGKKAGEIFKNGRYNFVIVSSTNTDSIMQFYRNTPKELEFVCDTYQAEILLAVMKERAGYSQYRLSQNHPVIRIIGKADIYALNEKAENLFSRKTFKSIKEAELEQKGFVMLVRKNKNPDKKSIFEVMRDKFCPLGAQFIYSMWDGYLSGERPDEDLLRFLEGRSPVKLHTSGHADAGSIADLIEAAAPKVIIPMHTEKAGEFAKIPEFEKFADRVRVLKDGERFDFADTD